MTRPGIEPRSPGPLAKHSNRWAKGRLGSSALVRQLVKEKENSEFKPVKLRLKIDLVSYPARAEGLVNMVSIFKRGKTDLNSEFSPFQNKFFNQGYRTQSALLWFRRRDGFIPSPSVVYWPSTRPDKPFQRRGSCIFHWRRRAWLTIWGKVKSRGTVIDWCTGRELLVNCMTVISAWWQSNMPFQG